MAGSAPDRQQSLRRRHKHERQAVIFGSLVAALAVAGLGATAVYTDVLEVPFLQREFTTPPAEEVADTPDAPCVPEGTLPVAYNTIQVNVLNGSGRVGLAGATSTSLTGRGFLVLETGNYPSRLVTNAQLGFGQAGLAAAYTLAANLESATLVLDQREDATVDLVLGEAFSGLLDPAAVALDMAAPLASPEGCIALEAALIQAGPAPSLAPAEGETEDETTGDEPIDGGEGFEDAPADG